MIMMQVAFNRRLRFQKRFLWRSTTFIQVSVVPNYHHDEHDRKWSNMLQLLVPGTIQLYCNAKRSSCCTHLPCNVLYELL